MGVLPFASNALGWLIFGWCVLLPAVCVAVFYHGPNWARWVATGLAAVTLVLLCMGCVAFLAAP